ncbi:MAG: hypothetical protein ACE15C_09370 [Phycisphaerae bacterium]
MATESLCPQCRSALSPRELVLDLTETESCPHCGAIVRQRAGYRSAKEDAVVAHDVAAIEGVLAELSHELECVATDESQPDQHVERRWRIHIEIPRTCEMIYDRSRLHFVAVRLIAEDRSKLLPPMPARLQTVCADHAVEFVAERDSAGKAVWGAQQYLSTGALCPKLIQGVVARLQEAMQGAEAQAA